VEENASGSAARQVQQLAYEKGEDVFRQNPQYPVLAADTLVCLDDVILGKPKNRQEAAAMLSLLSERWHQVFTGVCLFLPDGRAETRLAATSVLFRRIGEAELERYTASDEPMDKAGAYAMQGVGSLFIDRIDGSPSNVIGLPLCEVKELLEIAGLYP
ncbi:MAG: septum formation protein Maf, partial [Firmicutes bacterium]|nr:septum formation protein Maf [Bacillota bacterium]